MKDEFGGVIVIKLIGLKSKIYSMKKIDDKQCNTAKGVSIATEFDKFKDILLNEKVIRHKMERIQSKEHKLETQEIEKISLLCLTIKDMCLMMEFVPWLIFIKIVSQVVKRLKKIVMIEKIVIKMIIIKKIVMIKKDFDQKNSCL